MHHNTEAKSPILQFSQKHIARAPDSTCLVFINAIFLQKISPFKRMIQTVHSMVLFIAEQIERGLTFTKNLEYGEPFIGFVQVAYRIEFELLSCQDY